LGNQSDFQVNRVERTEMATSAERDGRGRGRRACGRQGNLVEGQATDTTATKVPDDLNTIQADTRSRFSGQGAEWAFSSVGESTPLIRVRPVVRVHERPPGGYHDGAVA
jgi:hypothetical protein